MTTTPALSATGAVPSPCINVCHVDTNSGLCNGCLRTLDEITLWSVLDDEDKRAVWAALALRRRATRPPDTPQAGNGAPE